MKWSASSIYADSVTSRFKALLGRLYSSNNNSNWSSNVWSNISILDIFTDTGKIYPYFSFHSAIYLTDSVLTYLSNNLLIDVWIFFGVVYCACCVCVYVPVQVHVVNPL